MAERGPQGGSSAAPPPREGGEQFFSTAPAVNLPKGGGAVRGIGEKFAANPVTGTGSLSVPVATSPGRSGLGPQYLDAQESDVFLLSGAEDLVPVLNAGGSRFSDETTAPGYVIRRYRPRVEGLFARIERWTDTTTGESHCRSISRDNVTTWYGRTAESRVADPADPAKVFSWLICQSYDDKGNAIVYEYAPENGEGVDLGLANERNRVRTPNRHLKRVKYGNRQPNRDLTTWEATDSANLPLDTWMFEVVLDYGEGHYQEVPPDQSRPPDEQHRFVRASPQAARPWELRPDPFSSHRAGFEVRTYRRCRRVLMFHHVPDLPGGERGYDGLVRSTEFDYADLEYRQPVTVEQELAHQGSTRFASFVRRVTQSGYVREGASYLKKSLPPLEFEYSKAVIHDEVLELDRESLENLPVGLDGSAYQWVDLHGEGVSGVLSEQAGAWFYKRNLSPLPPLAGGSAPARARLGPAELVRSKPNLSLASGAQVMVFAGDGRPVVAVLDRPTPGFHPHDEAEGWKPFKLFTDWPNIDLRNPNLRRVDVNADGRDDLLITEGDSLVWHPSLGEEGFGPARRIAIALDEEKGPRLVFDDGTESIYLADMSGDGLTNIVRVRNGEVCYWPIPVYGGASAKVTLDNAPWFDQPDQFSQRRVRLADLDGSGTSDILYLHRDGVRIYFNQSGNRLCEARHLGVFPKVDDLSSVTTADLLGNGTACLVWSSPLPGAAGRQVRYVNLMGEAKPHLLVRSVNNLGAETRVRYASSARFYLEDKFEGRPWVTRLPFPVQVVERVETYDHVSRNRFVTRYKYHHGYFDGEEREFRGFGMVEQFDTEAFAALSQGGALEDAANLEEASHVPPVLTKTWFHTGAYLDRGRVSRQFAHEYYREPGLTDDEAGRLLLEDRAARGPLATGGARGLPGAQGLDAAPGGLRARRHRQGAAPLHRHRAEPQRAPLAGPGRQPPRGVLHPPPRGPQLPLRAQPI